MVTGPRCDDREKPPSRSSGAFGRRRSSPPSVAAPTGSGGNDEETHGHEEVQQGVSPHAAAPSQAFGHSVVCTCSFDSQTLLRRRRSPCRARADRNRRSGCAPAPGAMITPALALVARVVGAAARSRRARTSISPGSSTRCSSRLPRNTFPLVAAQRHDAPVLEVEGNQRLLRPRPPVLFKILRFVRRHLPHLAPVVDLDAVEILDALRHVRQQVERLLRQVLRCDAATSPARAARRRRRAEARPRPEITRRARVLMSVAGADTTAKADATTGLDDE